MSDNTKTGAEEQQSSVRVVMSNSRRAFLVRTGWATASLLAAQSASPTNAGMVALKGSSNPTANCWEIPKFEK